MTEKKGLVEKLQEKLLPMAQRLQRIDWLQSIAEGLGSITTVITAGSLALAICNLPFAGFQNVLKSTGLYDVFFFIYLMTMNILSLYTCIGIAYRYADKLDESPLPAVIVSLMTYLCLLPISADRANLAVGYLGASGMFVAILAALGGTRLVKLFNDKGLSIKLPAGVPSFIVESFKTFISGLAITLVAGLFNLLFAKTSYGSLPAFVYGILQAPLVKLSTTVGGTIIVTAISELFFFTGIHGMSISSFLMPGKIAASAKNAELIAAGLAPTEIFSRASMNWTSIGGAGSTLGLCFLMCFLAKSARYKTLGRVAIIPQICNINEPVLYGMPIILNPVMILPFCTCSAVTTLIYYFACKTGLMPVPMGISAGMGVPNIVAVAINGVGVRGMIVFLVCFAVDLLIYYPFFRVMDNMAYKEELAANEAE